MTLSKTSGRRSSTQPEPQRRRGMQDPRFSPRTQPLPGRPGGPIHETCPRPENPVQAESADFRTPPGRVTMAAASLQTTGVSAHTPESMLQTISGACSIHRPPAGHSSRMVGLATAASRVAASVSRVDMADLSVSARKHTFDGVSAGRRRLLNVPRLESLARGPVSPGVVRHCGTAKTAQNVSR